MTSMKRAISILLCIAMLFTMLPTVFADDAAPVDPSIDFTNPADASKFELVGTAAIEEGVGLTLITTQGGIEPAKQNIAEAENDVVKIPVSGDWTASLEVAFDTNNARNGYYQFFAFFASEGGDNQNMVGIRGGDGAMQDFIRKNGTITEETKSSSPGFSSSGSTYYLRLEKEGTTYRCYRSDDGDSYTEMFSFEDCDIEADEILIDAYTGQTTGYKFILKYLELEGDFGSTLDKKALRAAIREAKTFDSRFWTEESFAVLTTALEAAQKTLNEATTQEEIDAATAALRAAIDGLVKNPNLPKMRVTFNYNFPGCPDPVVVEVEQGSTVEALPLTGIRTGYAGTWRNGNQNFNFSTPITDDITLTANWTKDWNQMWSLPKEYEGFFSFGNFGTENPGSGQTEVEYSTYSGNDGKMTYNFDQSASARDGVVRVRLSSGLRNALNNIRNWNNNHPDGPKKYYRQHVLFWHGSEQNTAFYREGFQSNGKLVTREVMNERIDQYVEAMFKACQEYDDVILSWDIVNEALDDFHGMVRNGYSGSDDADSQTSAWGTIYRMKDENGNPVKEFSEERLLYESEWIRVAFASARKWQKELGVHWKLYYNDYMNSNMVYEPKMSNTIKVLQPIYAAGNIDGYGMQARLAYAYPTVDMLRNQIELGLTVADEVSFSEADVRCDFEPNPKYDPLIETRRVTQEDGESDYTSGGSGSWKNIGRTGNYNNPSSNIGNTYDVFNSRVRRKNSFNNSNIDETSKKAQADLWADLVDIMLEKAAEGKVGAIAIDGTSDSNTFNRDTGCQIWDTSGNEKPAFYALVGAPNRFKMGEAIKAGPAKNEEANYTPETWAPYVAALDAAEALVDVRIYDDAGVRAVKNATANLIAATEALKLKSGVKLDLTALNKAIADGKAVDADKFDDVTVQDVNRTVADGETVAAAPISQNQINNAAQAINDAIANLVGKGETRNYYRNTEELEKAIEEAEQLNENDWTPETWAVLAEVLEEAKDILANDFTQERADISAMKIAAATAKLEAANPDALKTAALKKAIADAEALVPEEYTPESYAKIAAPLAAAKKALEEAKTQAEIDKAQKDLQDALDALVKVEPEPVLDKEALEKAIQDAEAVKKDDYTEETVKALDDALAAAKKVLTDAKTQDELDDAAKALNDAIKALEKKPEDPGLKKDELEKAIEDAEKLDADKYTEESAKALAEAIAAAKKALEEAKTQAELDAAKKALDDAIAALVEKTEPTPIPTPTPHVCPGANFTDMPAEDYWSHAAIDWAIVNKITVGTSDTTFGPTEGCTRAQVVTFLWRAAKEPAPTSKENPFKDVKESDYFYNAVLWAVEKGITVGTEPDKFSPGETCTRAQIVTFLYRYEGKPEVKPDDSFTDVKPGDYFADSVAWAVANGITKGTDPGKFSPADTCTREQVVTFLYRSVEK